MGRAQTIPASDQETHFLSVVPHFTVSDVVRTAEYYRDKLGFEIAGYWDGERRHQDSSRAVVFGIVRRDDVSIHFNKSDPSTTTRTRAEGAYDAYFHVVGVDGLANWARARGAKIIEGPENRPYGQRELVLVDCDEHVLAFGEATAGG